MITRLRKILLELGRDFLYVAKQNLPKRLIVDLTELDICAIMNLPQR